MNYIINMINAVSPPHQHKEYEIIVYTKGQGTSYAADAISVTQGDIMIMPPNTVHQCAFSGELERIYIRGEFGHCFSFSAPVFLKDNPQQEGIVLANMIYRNRFANPEYLSALMDAFLHYLMKSICTQDRIHTAVTHIINEMTSRFYEYDLDLRLLLEESGYAQDYIRAHFKKITGKTPVEFLTEVRIRHACFLIDTYAKSVPLTDIASQCGYTDYVYFSKKFKSLTGISPRTYLNNTFV